MTAPPEPRATIYDVARVAGVSASTVSRAFSRPGRVSARTAARVREVAATLGYRAEPVATADAATRTHLVGLALADVTNPYVFGLIRGAQSAAARAGHSVLLLDAQEDEEVERANLRRALPHLDGLVVASPRLSDTHLRTLARHLPTVVLSRDVQGLPCIVPDEERGMRLAAEHLAGLGHGEVWYVPGPETSYANGLRWRSLLEAAPTLGLTVHQVGDHGPTLAGGRAAAAELLDRGATAVLAYNDLMAFGVVVALREAGVSVPTDVSVVGFDDVYGAELLSPALTTVAAPLVTMGEMAVGNVLAMARGARTRREGPVVTPVTLKVRGSTAPPR